MKKIVFIIIMLFWSLNIYSEGNELKNVTDVTSFCEKIMTSISHDKMEKAFNELKKIWLFPETEFTNLETQTIKQMILVKERFGNSIGYKLIKQDTINEFLLKYTYVVKYDKHIIRWIFIFYKPKDKWLLNSIKWDDSIGSLFQ